MGILATTLSLLPDNTFFLQLVIFAAVVGVLNWGVFGPVLRLLDLRKRKTVGDSTLADDILARSAKLAAEYTEKIQVTKADAHAIKEELRQQGFASATEIMNEARKISLASLEQARHTIAQEVEVAKKTLTQEANMFAVTIVNKLAPKDAKPIAGKGVEENGVAE